MIDLPSAVDAYNRAAQQLDSARRLLHAAMDADAARRGAGRQVAMCGMPSGYYVHVRKPELMGPACPACLEAHRRAEARRVRRAS